MQEPRDTTPGKPAEARAQRHAQAVQAAEPATPPSLIETMRMEAGGRLPLLALHLQRLQRSSAALAYPCPDEASLRAEVARASARLDTSQAWRLRMLLAADGALSLETTALPPSPSPLKIVVQGPRARGAESWLLHKTTHRPWYQQATQWLADHPDIFDVLYWNEDGSMSEGSRSNLYMQTADGRWLTPPLAAGALPGVQRQALLRERRVKEATIQRDEFLDAPAIRISNALRGWCAAVITEG